MLGAGGSISGRELDHIPQLKRRDLAQQLKILRETKDSPGGAWPACYRDQHCHLPKPYTTWYLSAAQQPRLSEALFPSEANYPQEGR